MKKLSLLIVVAVVAMFSSFQAFAQDTCAKCFAPKTCKRIEVDVPNVGTVFYTLCYNCEIMYNGITAELIQIENMKAGEEDAVFDFFYHWFRDNAAILCGVQPCNVGSTHLVLKMPMCADFHYDGNNDMNYTITINQNSCLKYCVKDWFQCWCNCTLTVIQVFHVLHM
ncbi:MAG: hypothetical protein NT007_04470 [Candidatus Kapabacteria bacterium]|nr:hypothetical protein [Candidatus Kapabacteria bacterium]